MGKNLGSLTRAACVCALLIITVFTVTLAVQTYLRVPFPWDLYLWPESPFLTNMLKLEAQPFVYDSPEDGNSFVYSPGTEYLCYALLKPFGAELDIRFCRLVIVLLGLISSGIAAFTLTRLVKPGVPVGRQKLFFAMSWCLVLLSLGKNLTFDIVHPDALHLFLAVLLLCLCFRAWETKSFGLALLAMIMAGLGILTKQTAALSVFGVAICLVGSRQWNWRQSLVLVGVGAVTSAISLWLLWLPHYGRFFTLDLLSQHTIYPSRIMDAAMYLAQLHGGLLMLLSFLALAAFWCAGNTLRRYTVCWLIVGMFTVLPALAAYAKDEGMKNNLEIFRTWMVLIAAPFIGIMLNAALSGEKAPMIEENSFLKPRPVQFGLVLLALLGLLWFRPNKATPTKADYEYCQAIEEAVRDDVQHGRSVLVAHGTEMLIRSGSSRVPLDRANSLRELDVGHLAGLAKTCERVQSRYYDRIYLSVGYWYGTEVLAEMARNYDVEAVIKAHPRRRHSFEQGFQDELMFECTILKAKKPSETESMADPLKVRDFMRLEEQKPFMARW